MCLLHFICKHKLIDEPNNFVVWPNTINHITAKQKPPKRVVLVLWWEWVDSNHLSRKTTDLQSAPALQLRRTPKTFWLRPPQSMVRAEGIRTYKNTMSCVISNELMFASQGYPIHTLPATSLVRAEGIEPSFQAWKACILAFELCSLLSLSPLIISYFFINASVYSVTSTLSIYLRDTFSNFTG